MAATAPNITSSHQSPKSEWEGKGQKDVFFLPRRKLFSQQFPFISHWPDWVSWPPLAAREVGKATSWQKWMRLPHLAWANYNSSLAALTRWLWWAMEYGSLNRWIWHLSQNSFHSSPSSTFSLELPIISILWCILPDVFAHLHIRWSRHLAICLFFHAVKATILLFFSFSWVKNKPDCSKTEIGLKMDYNPAVVNEVWGKLAGRF